MSVTAHTKTYFFTLILNGITNKSDVQLFAYNYLQLLKKLGAINITAINKKDYQLAYPIQKIGNVNFIEFSFTVAPKALVELKQKVKFDEMVLRSFLIKES